MHYLHSRDCVDHKDSKQFDLKPPIPTPPLEKLSIFHGKERPLFIERSLSVSQAGEGGWCNVREFEFALLESQGASWAVCVYVCTLEVRSS